MEEEVLGHHCPVFRCSLLHDYKQNDISMLGAIPGCGQFNIEGLLQGMQSIHFQRLPRSEYLVIFAYSCP